MEASLPPPATRGTPILKLFGTDVPALRSIRDKIYSYAWSRDRRDEHKLDWVVSQRGFNRNVPERFFPDTPYGSVPFQRLDQLPCNLHLANKEISDDFTRYIYSVNDLEINVDLKPTHTKDADACLNEIVAQLQNPNFQKYTRRVRVRIHFPSLYPRSQLPAPNQRALEAVANTLDGFHNLGHLAIRVVPGQGSPLDYEIHVAAFPFYPMRMTNWSLRILTNTRPSRWDLLNAQQVRQLDQAWLIYNNGGSLTAPTKSESVAPDPVPHQVNTTGDTASSSKIHMPKTGSQKRKERKKKAAARWAAQNNTTSAATHSAAVDAASDGGAMDPQPSGPHIAPASSSDGETRDSEPAIPPSPTHSPVKLQVTTATISSSTSTSDVVLTPPESLDGTGSTSSGLDVRTGEVESRVAEHPQSSRPPSPAFSSVTLGPTSEGLKSLPDTDDDDDRLGEYIRAMQLTETDRARQQAKKQKPKKHSRKKPKKSRAAKSVAPQSDSVPIPTPQDEVDVRCSDEEVNVQPTGSTAASLEQTSDAIASSSGAGTSRMIPLAQVRLVPFGPNHIYGVNPATGSAVIFPRSPSVVRYLRRQERLDMDEVTRRAEQKEAKGKRGSKKAKQISLRRDNIAADSPLSRAMERQREEQKTKKAVEQRDPHPSSDSVKNATEMLLRTFRKDTPRDPEHHFNFVDNDLGSGVQEAAGGFAHHDPLEEDQDTDRDISTSDDGSLFGSEDEDEDEDEVYHSAEERSPTSSMQYDHKNRTGQSHDEIEVPCSPKNDLGPVPMDSWRDRDDHDVGAACEELEKLPVRDHDQTPVLYPEFGPEQTVTAADQDSGNPFVLPNQPITVKLPSTTSKNLQ